MNDLPFPLPDFTPGSVWLVGAGPGDPGLLTLLAVQALRHADVIVYDALVDDRILALAGPGAELDYAGKRGGKPSPKQTEISDHLVALAQAGKRVLRLKGGDPFVFGRGAEEALHLADHGIPFRIVPGITAGIGGLAYAGIPATTRDTNSAVTFVTGHSATGDLPDGIDWDALAKGSPVLIFYMAMKHLDRLTERLIQGGRRPDEAAAIVTRAATPDQRIVEGSIATIADLSHQAGLEPPALLVVGEVVRLRDRLAWLDPATAP